MHSKVFNFQKNALIFFLQIKSHSKNFLHLETALILLQIPNHIPIPQQINLQSTRTVSELPTKNDFYSFSCLKASTAHESLIYAPSNEHLIGHMTRRLAFNIKSHLIWFFFERVSLCFGNLWIYLCKFIKKCFKNKIKIRPCKNINFSKINFSQFFNDMTKNNQQLIWFHTHKSHTCVNCLM